MLERNGLIFTRGHEDWLANQNSLTDEFSRNVWTLYWFLHEVTTQKFKWAAYILWTPMSSMHARIKSLLHPQLWQLADIRFPIVPRYSLLETTASPWKPCDSPKIFLRPPPPPHKKHTSLVINSVASIAPKKCFLVSKEKNVTYETTSALQKNTFPVSGTTRKLLFNTGGDSVNVTKR